MELRPYQHEAISALTDFYLTSKVTKGLCVLPTASGKTVIFAQLIKQLIEQHPSLRVLMLAHTQEIVQQNEDKLKAIWPDADIGIYCAGLGRKEIKQITSASRDSIIKEIGEYPEWDLVIVDEAHLIPPEQTARYQYILDTISLHGPEPKIIGFTATPFRMQSGEIFGEEKNKLFKKLIYRKRIDELVNSGYLCNLRAVVTDNRAVADTSKVRVSKNDFVQTDLEQVTAVEPIVEAIVADWLNKTSGNLPTVFFASSVAQAHMFEHCLATFGFDFPLITATTAKAQRAEYLSEFESGNIQGLVNVATLTTGWDAPRLACIVNARPTRSPALFLQIVGRGLRLHPSKNETLLLDYGQNLERFGVLERVKPELEDRQHHDEQNLVTACEVCDTVVSVYELECPFCTETLRDDDISICYECNAGNDRYSQFCEVCGEVLEENII
ncbi:DEAD/DEAH box helicase [Pseudoalteromonas sp. T1lg48]|uniref:DEAD/DEAH box helicase n=1 Tax=Pseudoalteromonas sp. T1lg48 TaxID=2077100 RepID=UPI000CF6D0AE|nr:DEAD/DEAH box helicase [Pseudoalteromonas sp. T1lg48]